MKAFFLRIQGKVQGVFFRASMKQKADELAVHGWVRNCADGSVEAHVQGTNGHLEAIIAWAAKGPEQAVVQAVDKEPVAPIKSSGFSIEKSA